MKIFDANISGSLTVSGSAHFQSDITVDGVINATISGTTSNAISASFATYAATAGNANLLDNMDSTQFATTGSNTFKGGQIVSGSISIVDGGDLYINGQGYTTQTSGTSGTSGSSGSSGTSGSSGSDGTSGTSGSSGSSGSSGTSGSSGSSGTSGSSGSDGSSGTSGTSGSSGSSGTSGTSGSSGSSGSSGTSGSSGSSGTVTMTGTQDNGLLTLNGSSPNATVETNLTYDGSLFNINSNTTITGSLIITDNLNVLGSSSITYTTASQLRVNDNIITVNASSPGVRFAGLSVYDSGSSPLVSGSFLFDSLNNQFVYVHTNQATVTSSVVLVGAQTYDSLGSETLPTQNRVIKSLGQEHLGDSNITDTGTKVSINSGTEVTGSVYITTALGVGTNTPTTTGLIRATNDVIAYYGSDERLKENILTISGSLDILKQINGYYFDWKEMPGIHENEGHDIGVIAQEIEAVLPEIVTTRDNGYKAVKYEKLVALLIQTNKELLERVEALEAKIK